MNLLSGCFIIIDTTQHNTTQHNTTQHNTTQHNTTQHNTTQQININYTKLLILVSDIVHALAWVKAD
jgi:hypothetical protein